MERLTVENFENVVNKEKGPFVIKFFSPTCGPCKTMTPVFEAFDHNNPNVSVYEIDTMESPELASHFGVRGVPYVVFCEGREVLYEFTGVTPLGNLQYVVDNINDPHFRETGDFKKADVKKSHAFEASVALIVIAIIAIIIFI